MDFDMLGNKSGQKSGQKSKQNSELSDEMIGQLSARHRWAATGVSDYPPRDPLVGQSRFFNRFKTFLHTVDHDDDHFAHVFAVEAEWGRGKSRLGHELVAQINDCSKGWYVRTAQGELADQQLFDEASQDKYLALYIRYSQVASDYQNSDNWFAFGLYQALLPLATGQFDGSIQSEIAKQALERLNPMGFDHQQLAKALELDKNHSEEDLYEDPNLAVQLVQAAYTVLNTFGIDYVLVVLDELETVAEAATFGLEDESSKRLDGQAIRLIGKAIKEEDPRRKLPWLRYVALCSPLLGQQLREIQSVARRFELVELEHNAFADVSDYVKSLESSGKLAQPYQTGLVEAAYAMSGANFGWFNVVMANVDAVLEQFDQAGKTLEHVGELFEAVLEGSGRVAKHVLDAGAIEGIQTRDQALLTSCRNLLYGQLPVPLAEVPNSTELLTLKNEDQEPVVALYRKLSLDRLSCRQALEQAKFRRDKDEWVYPAVEQALSLDTLLDNLRTFSIKESINEPIKESDKESGNKSDPNVVLLPLSQGEFKYLLSLLYDHPAIEFAADALWQKLIGDSHQLPDGDATHIGPSVAMLLRLDLRYRSAQHNTMIFRDPADSDGHETAMAKLIASSSKHPQLRLLARLTGLMRLLDNNWPYNQAALPNKAGKQQQALPIITEPKGQGAGQRGGLMTLDAFKLHPDGKALFAWVSNKDELDQLQIFAGTYRGDNGRTPVFAVTASAHLMEQYSRSDEQSTLRDDILLHYVNPSEVDQLERIGLDLNECTGFSLLPEAFTAKFKNKLAALTEFAIQGMHKWRARLNERGRIAWPIKINGKLNASERDLLLAGWRLLAIEQPSLNGLLDIQKQHNVNAEELAALLSKLQVPGNLLAKGFIANEHAGLFTELANPQQAQVNLPLFLARMATPSIDHEWTLDKAKQDWYFGYVAQTGITAKTVFDDWMWWCGELNLLTLDDPSGKKATWRSYPRSRLDNAINEAQIWFSGSAPDAYKAKVEILNRVFGYGRISELFAPIGASSQGTETVEANDHLTQARRCFNTLKTTEENLPSVIDDAVLDKLPELIRQRAEVLKLVDTVRPLNVPKVTLGSVHTLQLEDKTQSLFMRVTQACLFAEFVEAASKRISRRAEDLITDLEQDCRDLEHFPKAFFSQSLRTVTHILEGALSEDESSTTAKGEGKASSETLLHFLRSLKLDKAHERIALLASEVGVTLYSNPDHPNSDHGSQQVFTEVSGHILSAYRALKEKYEKTLKTLTDYKLQSEQLKAILDPMPSDYSKPEHVSEVVTQQQKLIMIGDAFEDLADDAERKRTALREAMRKGKFDGLRDIPEQLLQPIRSQLHPIGGMLNAIEKGINQFKQSKIEPVNDVLPGLRPLLKAQGRSVPDALELNSFNDESLSDVVLSCEASLQAWKEQAELCLAETGLNFSQWQAVFKAISLGNEPEITQEAREQLVKKGILKMRLTFASEQ
ncbi:hypothetical protein MO867_02265 [Microbulbifer sp. OS29]|uniref:Uncharacterized protein n=1 Tax=Microbulbifer okhotskensis TaxID=2926617 RepID=A0A9X2EPF2_9GAMM|nr:hypothetical protein [Microbulbifer okhotskensis]MCO1333156.1 hypothetical protein [Microbulbifer okhotskensis]